MMSSETKKPQDAGATRKAMSLEARLQASSKTKPENRLTKLMKREVEVIAEFKTSMERLKALMPRVKTEGIRDCVDELGALSEMLYKSRDEVRSEYRSLVAGEKARADTLVTENKVLDRVATSEAIIIGALDAISKRLDAHDATINGLTMDGAAQELKTQAESAMRTAAFSPSKVAERIDLMEDKFMGVLDLVQTKLAEQDGAHAKQTVAFPQRLDAETPTSWTEVVKKPRKARGMGEPRPELSEPHKQARTVKPQRLRPMAVIVAQGKEQFPELLKTIRQKVDPVVTGTSISRLRQTKTGNLLVEINGGSEKAEIVRAEIERSLGPNTSVRLADDSRPIEIRDLDGLTTKEEVLKAIADSCGPSGAKLVSLRIAYGGAQTAVILLSAAMAKRLCDAGRLRVGLVYARVRPTELPNRCFRCHAFGHIARECAGVDRTTCCWRCGEPGHQSRACTATLQVAKSYRDELSNAANEGTQRTRRPSRERSAPDLTSSKKNTANLPRCKDSDVDEPSK